MLCHSAPFLLKNAHGFETLQCDLFRGKRSSSNSSYSSSVVVVVVLVVVAVVVGEGGGGGGEVESEVVGVVVL